MNAKTKTWACLFGNNTKKYKSIKTSARHYFVLFVTVEGRYEGRRLSRDQWEARLADDRSSERRYWLGACGGGIVQTRAVTVTPSVQSEACVRPVRIEPRQSWVYSDLRLSWPVDKCVFCWRADRSDWARCVDDRWCPGVCSGRPTPSRTRNFSRSRCSGSATGSRGSGTSTWTFWRLRSRRVWRRVQTWRRRRATEYPLCRRLSKRGC